MIRRNLTFAAAILTGFNLISCTASPVQTEYPWPADAVMEAVHEVMIAYPSLRKGLEGFETGWEEEAFDTKAVPWGTRWVRVKYFVSVLGSRVSVEASAEAFVSAGAHRHQWQRIDSAPFTARLLNRVLEQLQSDEHPG